MHCVLPLVVGSLATHDNYQKLVSDPLNKKIKVNKSKKNWTLYKKPTTEVADPASLQFYTPIRKLKDKQTKLRI